jgi:predicted DNA-binding ribbon-helix-helix protein
MRSTLRKRSITVAGHQTSVSLEEAFWSALRRAAASRGLSVNALVEEIDRGRGGNLSSAIRVFLLGEALAGRLGEDGGDEGETGSGGDSGAPAP